RRDRGRRGGSAPAGLGRRVSARAASSSRTATPTRRGGGRSKGRTTARDSAAEALGSYRLRQLETSRFGIVYDIDGPRVRLGVAWFLAAIVCLYLGLTAVTALFAGVAGLAAAQTAT